MGGKSRSADDGVVSEGARSLGGLMYRKSGGFEVPTVDHEASHSPGRH